MSRETFFTGFTIKLLIAAIVVFILLANSGFLKEKAAEFYKSEDMKIIRFWVESVDNTYGK